MGSTGRDNAFSVHCPRCDVVLAFRAREGDALACEACGQLLAIAGGKVTWDPAGPSQRRHDIACPRCDRLLAFAAADGDRFECSGCGLQLDVDSGLVTYDPEAAARSRPRKVSARSPLRSSEREAVRRAHEAVATSLSPGDVRHALVRGERALERLQAAGDADAHARSRALRLQTLVQALKDWWDEEATFDWATASQIAAALQGIDAPGGREEAGEARDALLLDLCTDAVRPALEDWARGRGVDLAARGF